MRHYSYTFSYNKYVDNKIIGSGLKMLSCTAPVLTQEDMDEMVSDIERDFFGSGIVIGDIGIIRF